MTAKVDGDLSPINQSSLVDAVETEIRAHILSGRLEGGSLLRESTVASQLGVSRGPVREALRRLEQTELVVKPTNRSYAVATFSERDVLELAAVRSALEQLAAREAMNDPKQLEARLQERLSEIVGAVTDGDAVALIRADRRFHEEIVAQADNRRLTRVYATLRDQMDLSLMTLGVPTLELTMQHSVAWHERLLRPVRRGETDGFLAALDEHINSAARMRAAGSSAPGSPAPPN